MGDCDECCCPDCGLGDEFACNCCDCDDCCCCCSDDCCSGLFGCIGDFFQACFCCCLFAPPPVDFPDLGDFESKKKKPEEDEATTTQPT